MGIFRTLVGSTATTTTSTAIAAVATAAAFALPLLSPSLPPSGRRNLSFLSHHHHHHHRLGIVTSFTPCASASASTLRMDAPPSSSSPPQAIDLPELLTEYWVDMTCEGCVNAVKNTLQTLPGVKNVQVDLTNQGVRVLGTSTLKIMTEALHQTGRKARLIGQGVPEDFLISAAVAEFKGPQIFGVVRLAQVSMEMARIEANFSGLLPGKHGWSINEYGDLTKGAASTGKVFNPTNQDISSGALGDLGTLDADEKGEAYFSGAKKMLRVSDLIGRSVVVYETKDKSDAGITAAVIARSAAVGENYKKVCTCDGTTLWESTDSDFVPSKV